MFTVLMADPNWSKGFYYDGLPPHTGMKLARRRGHIPLRALPSALMYPFLPRNRHYYVSIWARMGPSIRKKVETFKRTPSTE